jgi:hypothetical protein
MAILSSFMAQPHATFTPHIIPIIPIAVKPTYATPEIPNSPPRLTPDEIFGLSQLAHNDNLRYGPRFKQ